MNDRVSRKEAKKRTRDRLIEAVLEHVRHEGLGGLTTGKITEAAGMAQSSFYVHFVDMDDLLQAAADRLGAEIRAIIRHERHKVDLRAADPTEALRAAYTATLNALLAEPGFTELLLGQRRDRSSPLGECLRAIMDSARADFLADLTALGLDASDPHLGVSAELIVGATLNIVEGILDGRLTDREACLDALVTITLALFR